MSSANLNLLVAVADRLKPLLDEVVFVGGCATGLLITDRAAAEVRATTDVDVIVKIATYAEHVSFFGRLRKLGFAEDTSPGAPICRWLIDGMVLDVMPTEETPLGFSDRWFRDALASAREHYLRDDLRIRVVTAPYFVAMKLEAFRDRGNDDYLASSDLEDLISVVDGRAEVIDEIKSVEAIRLYVANQFRQLLRTESFLTTLPGHLLPDPGSQGRVDVILDRMRILAENE
jgi:predicted nucleotidyltransferase